MYKPRIMLTTVALLSIMWIGPKVHAAYSASLVTPFKTLPKNFGMVEIPAPNAKGGTVMISTGDFKKTPRQAIMVPILMQSAKVAEGRMLWAMYPGSIRGRVFSTSGSVNDPFHFSSSSSSGGGW